MNKTTVTLGEIVNSNTPVFDFDYPMIAGHREIFEEKFIDHYYYREINFLAVDQFKQRLKSRLNMIMPLYLQQYKTENLIDNPFRTYKVMESYVREHDNDIFRKGFSKDNVSQIDETREGNIADLSSREIFGLTQFGDEDGTLDRDTTRTEKQVFTSDETQTLHSDEKQVFESTENETLESKEHMVLHTDTVSKTETDGTKESTQITDQDENTINSGSVTGTKDTDSTKQQDTVFHETKSGNKNDYFSDTPQENFVTGNSTQAGVPISKYATTVNQQTTSETTDSTTGVTGTDSEKQKTQENTQMDIDKTVDSSVNYNETSKETKTFDEDIDTDRVTDFNSERNTKLNSERNTGFDSQRDTDFNSERNTNETGTQDDITHQEYKDKQDTQTDFSSHTTSNGQKRANKDLYSVGTTVQDSAEIGTSKYTKEIQGYMRRDESAMLMSFRKTFLNIDRAAIEDCETLFLGVYALN